MARLRNFSHLPKSVWSLGYCRLAFLTLSSSHFDHKRLCCKARLSLAGWAYHGFSRSNTACECGSVAYNVSLKLPQCQTLWSKSSNASSDEAISHQSACPPLQSSSSPSQMRIALLSVKKR